MAGSTAVTLRAAQRNFATPVILRAVAGSTLTEALQAARAAAFPLRHAASSASRLARTFSRLRSFTCP